VNLRASWKCGGCARWNAPHVDQCACVPAFAEPFPMYPFTPWWEPVSPWAPTEQPYYTITSAGTGDDA
jgi:hypothetical protein